MWRHFCLNCHYNYSLPELFSRCTTNEGLIPHNNYAGFWCHCRILSCHSHQHLCHVGIKLTGVRIDLGGVRISQAGVESRFLAAWTPLQAARGIPGIITGSPGKGSVEGVAEIVENPADNDVVVDGHYSRDDRHAPTKAWRNGKWNMSELAAHELIVPGEI